tara:strand:+ start:314 stop:520 length:207 start_codon:yes stop_codon:yes gene_type:complete
VEVAEVDLKVLLAVQLVLVEQVVQETLEMGVMELQEQLILVVAVVAAAEVHQVIPQAVMRVVEEVQVK